MSVLDNWDANGADVVVLEGFHAVKHALRFDADVLDVMVVDLAAAVELCRSLSPDITGALIARARVVTRQTMLKVVNQLPHTGVVGLARRPRPARLGDSNRCAPLVVLDDPRHLGNLGATVRVAAGLRAAGVFVIGGDRLWHPTALRGSAGLHFALPVGETTTEELASSGREVLAMDADGDPLTPDGIASDTVLLLGSERSGLSPAARHVATRFVSIPIDHRVSSYNLATSVAMSLIYWKIRNGSNR